MGYLIVLCHHDIRKFICLQFFIREHEIIENLQKGRRIEEVGNH